MSGPGDAGPWDIIQPAGSSSWVIRNVRTGQYVADGGDLEAMSRLVGAANQAPTWQATKRGMPATLPLPGSWLRGVLAALVAAHPSPVSRVGVQARCDHLVKTTDLAELVRRDLALTTGRTDEGWCGRGRRPQLYLATQAAVDRLTEEISSPRVAAPDTRQ